MAETLQTDPLGRSASIDDNARWYACYTRARHEKRVEAVLQERGFDSFLPLIPKESQWKDRRKVVEWPLFPSYVFGRFPLTALDRVVSVPGVVGLVRAAGRPIAIADDDLENVRRFARGLRSGGVSGERRPFFAEGEWVEVTSGPFAGVKGVVVEDRGRQRVLIGLREIGQGTVVDVEAGTLRSLPPP